MSIETAQQEIVEEFSFFEDWMEKYEHIIELGKELESLEEEHKTDDNIVKGCQSRVWLYAYMVDRKVYFKADSDAIITKGLVALMVRALSGYTPKEIIESDLAFIEKIGLKVHLSPNRSNGLVSMIKKIKTYALAYSVKN